jgi:hypothetical protein
LCIAPQYTTKGEDFKKKKKIIVLSDMITENMKEFRRKNVA